MFKQIIHQINNALAELSGWLVTAIMALLILDIISRLSGRAVQGVSEFAVFALVATVYLGLSHCEEKESHLRVEFFSDRFKGRSKRISDTFDYAVAVIFVSVALYASWRSALFSFQTGESVPGTIPLPIYPAKFVVFTGLLFYLAQLIINLGSKWTGGDN
ncbi:MAG TPA: TRAP transporter small permease [Synergistales bacterium]|jgi:TRAP-type C4-dicarboxylate transport system permease small subunit|nr:TRAP transporter small permease [Synergistales bacterium]HRV71276.1 TRAP transporter small permease [Thermovirgaceae bacterium]